jgi:16S rRNA (guanine(966)-N(2))-methyltransferase RsmD
MPLRVIGGSLGGRRLEGPPRSGVRPTADRVREALFEVIGDEVEDARVLDLYAGTGALGIEALSRGAAWCDFVESDSKAQAVIRENLARTALLDVAKLYPLPVSRALSRLQGPYDLVVADPPYEYDRAESELAQMIAMGLLAEGGTLAVEHSQRKPWPQTLSGRAQLASRRYGDTRVTLYR